MDAFNQFKEELLSKRKFGKVHCILELVSEANQTKYISQSTQLDAINRIIPKFGFTPNEDWDILNRAQALSTLAQALNKDIAYRSEIMPYEEAQRLANAFISLFNEEKTIYLSNGMFYGSRSWNPITEATFDTGVIAFDNNKIGILWFEDED